MTVQAVDNAASGLSMELVRLARLADVGVTRESRRRTRWVKLTVAVWAAVGLAWWRATSLEGGAFVSFPQVNWLLVTPMLFFGLLIAFAVAQVVLSGRSPHVLYRPDQITTSLDDVVGLAPLKEDVTRTLDLFLSHQRFRHEMGGTPRRGLLFEGSPGTGKTHMARALAKESGVPFLFVSATSFQSMYYGATARKIRSYFRELRKAALREGGAIGFIEEIDAIAMRRNGLNMTAAPGLGSATHGMVTTAFTSEGTGGVVNELLVQMQSFDALTGGQKLQGWLVDKVNLFLPVHRQLDRPTAELPNVLIIAATNRADSLDPALLRPGRFDRRMTFDLPDKEGRRELVDYFLAKKAHDPLLDDPERRDALAGVTQGYSPVMIEHLMDEALVNAVRRGADGMDWKDLEQARLVEEVGLGMPVTYTAHEKQLIATHEAGHATAAWLVAPERRMEILTIIKRGGSLGMLAHGDREDVYTRSRSEMLAMIKIALAGQCAEEVFFGDVSTGPSGDLAYATGVAAQMVGAAGMDGSLVSFAAISGSGFNDTNLVGRVLGDSDDRERVETMLQERKTETRALIADHAHLVAALRDALLDRHELIGSEITEVLERAAARHAVTATSPAAAPAVVDLTALERTPVE